MKKSFLWVLMAVLCVQGSLRAQDPASPQNPQITAEERQALEKAAEGWAEALSALFTVGAEKAIDGVNEFAAGVADIGKILRGPIQRSPWEMGEDGYLHLQANGRWSTAPAVWSYQSPTLAYTEWNGARYQLRNGKCSYRR